MTAEREQLILVVEGRWPVWLADAALFPMLGGVFAFLIGALFVAFGLARSHSERVNATIVAGVGVVVAGVSKWLNGIARRRSWRVEFFEKEIRFKTRATASARVVVPWEDMAWFRDREAECVQVKLKGIVSSLIDLQIPTTTEKDRVAVLDILARHGITRRD